MGVTSRSSHSSTSDWQPESELTLVYSGTDVTVGSSTGWQTFTLDTPYFYDATNNLVVVVAKTCDDWTSGLQYYYTSTSNAVLYRQGDSNLSYAEYPTGTGTRSSYAANVKFDMTFVGGAEITVNPSTMDMGYRPNGAWMRPLEVNVSNLGAPATINAIEPTNSFFSVEGIETPMVLNYGEEVGFEIATGSTTAGAVNAQLVIAYTDDRAVNMYDLTAIAYDPVCPDVWELAQVVSSFPYTTNVSGVYDNYQLPGENLDGNDAVYKVTVDEDKLLTAVVSTGENPKVAVYAEDFGGQPGPGIDNNYTGPEIGPGAGQIVEADEFYFDCGTTRQHLLEPVMDIRANTVHIRSRMTTGTEH